MNLKYLFLLMPAVVSIILIVVLAQKPGQEAVVCNLSYIKGGDSCCLDVNGDLICDESEVLDSKENETIYKENKATFEENKTASEENETTELQNCTKGYTDDYDCYVTCCTTRKYQYENCSYEWVFWEHCTFDCKDGVCQEGILEKVYSSSEIQLKENEGWITSKSIAYDSSKLISDRARIGEKLFITGDIQVNMYNENPHLSGYIKDEQVNVYIYKNDLQVFSDAVITDKYGVFRAEKFIPEESGDYKIVFKVSAGSEQREFEEFSEADTTFSVSR